MSRGGATYGKTYVNMREQRVFKWTYISEVHGTLIAKSFSNRYPYLRYAQLCSVGSLESHKMAILLFSLHFQKIL